MEDTKVYELLTDLKNEMKEEMKKDIIEILGPQIAQVTDAVHNSHLKTQGIIMNENKILKNDIDNMRKNMVSKTHLGIIYTIFVVMMLFVGYVYHREVKLEQREHRLEIEIKQLILDLKEHGLQVNGDKIRRIDNLGND